MPAQGGLFRFVHDSHAALTDLAQYAVASDPFRSRGLFLPRVQGVAREPSPSSLEPALSISIIMERT